MGRLAQVLSFFRTTRNGANFSDVKINPGGEANVTCEHFSSPGDDSHPLVNDYAVVQQIPRSGGEVVTGYNDPINTPKAEEGEKRIYGRDPTTGLVVNQFHLKNDGTIIASNDNGSITLQADGTTIITNSAVTYTINISGSVRGDNGAGFFELLASGTFNVNGFTISPSGDATGTGSVTAPNIVGSSSIVASGKELVGHDHDAGTPPGLTGANN